SGGSPRLALMLSFTRWMEIGESGAGLYRVAADGSIETLAQVAFASKTDGGVVTVVPRSAQALFFFDERLLFLVPEAECPLAEGLRLGASGGTVRVSSVRVKDRSR